MSFPVTRPDRRILRRRRSEQPCVVHYGPGLSTPALMKQLDFNGARMRLLGGQPFAEGDVRIVLNGGDEVYGAAAWRIGDTIGVRRHARNAECVKRFQPPED